MVHVDDGGDSGQLYHMVDEGADDDDQGDDSHLVDELAPPPAWCGCDSELQPTEIPGVWYCDSCQTFWEDGVLHDVEESVSFEDLEGWLASIDQRTDDGGMDDGGPRSDDGDTAEPYIYDADADGNVLDDGFA